jgi:hypothetical protein
MALPGTYQARLTVAGQSQTAPLELRADPRLTISREDMQKQFDLERQISRRLSALYTAVNGIRDLRSEFARLEQRYKSAPAWEKLKSQTANLLEKIQANEDKMIQSRSKSTEGFVRFPVMLDEQLIYLNWSVDSTDAAPTDGQQQLFTQLSEKLQEQLNTWDAFLSRDLPAFNRAAGSAKIPVVEVRGK